MNRLMRCIYCYRAVPDRDESVRTVRLKGHPAILEIHWHRECFEVDPLHVEDLADALCLPDGVESDDVTRAAYLKLLDRAIEKTTRPLRELVDVVRDTNDLKVTLRGPGRSWGRPSLRPQATAKGRRGR